LSRSPGQALLACCRTSSISTCISIIFNIQSTQCDIINNASQHDTQKAIKCAQCKTTPRGMHWDTLVLSLTHAIPSCGQVPLCTSNPEPLVYCQKVQQTSYLRPAQDYTGLLEPCSTTWIERRTGQGQVYFTKYPGSLKKKILDSFSKRVASLRNVESIHTNLSTCTGRGLERARADP
jgi:hypothetical protein